MGALSWVRFARRVNGLVRQSELTNLETLIETEAERQPNSNYFVLACAIPAGIAIFGGGSVFVAWLSGNYGLPLLLGSILTAFLAIGAWYVFFRLYKSVPPSRIQLRKQVMKFLPRYCSLGNILGGESVMTEQFSALIDEAAGIYLKHCSDSLSHLGDAPTKAVRAIEESMSRLMEVALSKDRRSQEQAMVWALPMLVELRSLDLTLDHHSNLARKNEIDDPLAGLRDARSELEQVQTALSELQDHTSENHIQN